MRSTPCIGVSPARCSPVRGRDAARFTSLTPMQMCKRKLGTHIRGKKKREELAGVLRKMQASSKTQD